MHTSANDKRERRELRLGAPHYSNGRVVLRATMASGQPERILEERKVGTRVEYLVQWHGVSEPSWEARVKLVGSPALLKEWQKVKEATEAKDIKGEKHDLEPHDSRMSEPS